MNEIIEDAAVPSKHVQTVKKVTNNILETDMNKNVDAEPVLQSVADRHALLCNFMES